MCECLCMNAEAGLEICNELIEKRAQTKEEMVESFILRSEIYLLLKKYKVLPLALHLYLSPLKL